MPINVGITPVSTHYELQWLVPASIAISKRAYWESLLDHCGNKTYRRSSLVEVMRDYETAIVRVGAPRGTKVRIVRVTVEHVEPQQHMTPPEPDDSVHHDAGDRS